MEGFWDKKRAASYLSVSANTIDNLVRLHRLPYTLIANKRRFLKSDLDRLAEANRYDAEVAEEKNQRHTGKGGDTVPVSERTNL